MFQRHFRVKIIPFLILIAIALLTFEKFYTKTGVLRARSRNRIYTDEMIEKLSLIKIFCIIHTDSTASDNEVM